MSAKKAENCRRLLKELAASLAEGRGISTQEVLAAFYKKHASEIEEESRDLVDLGLSRIAGDLARSRMGVGNGNQLEMFGDMIVADTRHIWALVAGKPKRLLRHTKEITIDEAEYHLAEIERRKLKRQNKPDDLAELVERAKKAGAGGITKLGDFEG